jgi:DNA polymerase
MTVRSPEEALAYLRWNKLGDCTRCDLCRKRQRVVFGAGDADADLMLVGEAPGAEEDRKGEPFVGRSGQLLTWFLEQVGLSRPQVYIANVIKCRPPGNRDPEPAEIAACAPFLHTQIWLVQPKAIIALGRFAGNLLAGQERLAISKLRTGLWTYENARTKMSVPVVPTYHPAYVLRKNGSVVERQTKMTVVGDFQKALRYIEEGQDIAV